jgi:hypothetical protein
LYCLVDHLSPSCLYASCVPEWAESEFCYNAGHTRSLPWKGLSPPAGWYRTSFLEKQWRSEPLFFQKDRNWTICFTKNVLQEHIFGETDQEVPCCRRRIGRSDLAPGRNQCHRIRPVIMEISTNRTDKLRTENNHIVQWLYIWYALFSVLVF